MPYAHRLISKDPEALTGTCVTCGPIALARRSNGPGRPAGFACSIAVAGRKASPNRNRAKRGKHGLTVDEARAHRDGKSCEICGSVDRLHVDHDHGTGEIRGVLCHGCNTGIGLFGDDPARLIAAAEYLTAKRLAAERQAAS